jgi:DNA-binding transcriptional LysR family regulator
MDRLASMSTFLAVVDGGSLSAAARRLGMPLATVSRKVSDLEAHLGTRLLNRSSRRLALTDAGRAYLTACRKILDDIEAAERAAVATRVGAVRRVVCGSPAYFAAHGTPEHPGDLGRHACITFSGATSPAEWKFADAKSTLPVKVRSRLTVNTAEAAVDAVVAGLGVTRVLSYQVAEAVKAGQARIVLRDFEPPPSPVSLVYPGQALLPVKLRAFLDFAAPRLKARLAAIAA